MFPHESVDPLGQYSVYAQCLEQLPVSLEPTAKLPDTSKQQNMLTDIISLISTLESGTLLGCRVVFPPSIFAAVATDPHTTGPLFDLAVRAIRERGADFEIGGLPADIVCQGRGGVGGGVGAQVTDDDDNNNWNLGWDRYSFSDCHRGDDLVAHPDYFTVDQDGDNNDDKDANSGVLSPLFAPSFSLHGDHDHDHDDSSTLRISMRMMGKPRDPSTWLSTDDECGIQVLPPRLAPRKLPPLQQQQQRQQRQTRSEMMVGMPLPLRPSPRPVMGDSAVEREGERVTVLEGKEEEMKEKKSRGTATRCSRLSCRCQCHATVGDLKSEAGIPVTVEVVEMI